LIVRNALLRKGNRFDRDLAEMIVQRRVSVRNRTDKSAGRIIHNLVPPKSEFEERANCASSIEAISAVAPVERIVRQQSASDKQGQQYEDRTDYH
jgi:hypothetical protein